MAYTKRKKRPYKQGRKTTASRTARRGSGRRTAKRVTRRPNKQQRTQTVRLVIEQPGTAPALNPNLVRVSPKRSSF